MSVKVCCIRRPAAAAPFGRRWHAGYLARLRRARLRQQRAVAVGCLSVMGQRLGAKLSSLEPRWVIGVAPKTKNRRFCPTSPMRSRRCGAVHPMRLSRSASFHAAGPQSGGAPSAISRFAHLEQTATTPQIPKVGLVNKTRPGSLVFILSQSANIPALAFHENRITSLKNLATGVGWSNFFRK